MARYLARHRDSEATPVETGVSAGGVRAASRDAFEFIAATFARLVPRDGLCRRDHDLSVSAVLLDDAHAGACGPDEDDESDLWACLGNCALASRRG